MNSFCPVQKFGNGWENISAIVSFRGKNDVLIFAVPALGFSLDLCSTQLIPRIIKSSIANCGKLPVESLRCTINCISNLSSILKFCSIPNCLKSSVVTGINVPVGECIISCLLYTSDAADEEDSVDLG